MLDELRKPFLIIAIIVMVFVVLIETSSPWLLKLGQPNTANPGCGIQFLAFVDGYLLLVTILIGLALVVPENIQAKLQGFVTLLFSFLGCLGAISAVLTTLVFVMIMVSLLLAPIFGTIAYFVLYADFDKSSANIILTLLMSLKVGYVVMMLLAHQRFLQNKSLVLLTLTSLLASLIVSFSHNLVPGFLVSITDAVGAIVVAIIAIVWAIVFAIGSIIAIFKSVT